MIENTTEIMRIILILIVGILFYLNINNIQSIYNVNIRIINLLLFILCLFVLAIYFGVIIIINLIFLIIVGWGALFVFTVSRKYLYGVSVVFIILGIFFLLLNYWSLAEYFALIGFSFLAVAVFKDIFYEKIFNN